VCVCVFFFFFNFLKKKKISKGNQIGHYDFGNFEFKTTILNLIDLRLQFRLIPLAIILAKQTLPLILPTLPPSFFFFFFLCLPSTVF
jgi:hypothetical protein